MKHIIYVIDSTDFHAVDWYKTVKKICNSAKFIIATDIIALNKTDNLLNKTDNIF